MFVQPYGQSSWTSGPPVLSPMDHRSIARRPKRRSRPTNPCRRAVNLRGPSKTTRPSRHRRDSPPCPAFSPHRPLQERTPTTSTSLVAPLGRPVSLRLGPPRGRARANGSGWPALDFNQSCARRSVLADYAQSRGTGCHRRSIIPVRAIMAQAPSSKPRHAVGCQVSERRLSRLAPRVGWTLLVR